MSVGCDMGTAETKVACTDSSGKPSIINNERGEPTTPSAIYLPPSGSPLVGRDAIEQGVVDPENLVRDAKREAGSNASLLNGRAFTFADATAALIGHVKQNAESHLNQEVTELVATCPANFRDDQKQPILEAFERNNIEVLLLLTEPTAAGMAYALDRQGSKFKCAIYDFGGGTFDVSILQIDGSQVSVLSTEGVSRLGGRDITQCIQALVLDQLESQIGKRPKPQDDPLFFLDLSIRAEAAKISLGKQSSVPIVASYGGHQAIVKVSRDWYGQAIKPLLDQSLEAMDRAMDSAGLSYSQLQTVVMVGGTSKIPEVQQAVADHTGVIPKASVDPIKAVAYGAAISCAIEQARRGHKSVIPSPDLFVRDVTAHEVGCCVVDDTGPSRRLIQSVIIPKNTPIPCQRADQFFLEHEDQTEARVEILQGDPEADRDDCLLIGELALENLPPEQKRTQRIHIEYTIDANGMVTATATDKVSSQQKTVSVDYKKGVKPKDKPVTV